MGLLEQLNLLIRDSDLWVDNGERYIRVLHAGLDDEGLIVIRLDDEDM